MPSFLISELLYEYYVKFKAIVTAMHVLDLPAAYTVVSTFPLDLRKNRLAKKNAPLPAPPISPTPVTGPPVTSR